MVSTLCQTLRIEALLGDRPFNDQIVPHRPPRVLNLGHGSPMNILQAPVVNCQREGDIHSMAAGMYSNHAHVLDLVVFEGAIFMTQASNPRWTLEPKLKMLDEG